MLPGGARPSVGEERGDARLSGQGALAGGAGAGVAPEQAGVGGPSAGGSGPRILLGRAGESRAARLGQGREGAGWAKGERARAGPSAKAGRSGVRAGLGKVVWAGFGFEFCFGFSSYFLFLFYF